VKRYNNRFRGKLGGCMGRNNFQLSWGCSSEFASTNLFSSVFTSICDFIDFLTLGPITSSRTSRDSHKVFSSRSKITDLSGIRLSIFWRATLIIWICFVRITNSISCQFTILRISRWSPPGYCQLFFTPFCESHRSWSFARYWKKRKRRWCRSLLSIHLSRTFVTLAIEHFGYRENKTFR
jgi:hypothetical protein